MQGINNTRISIIVPCYNGEKYLRETLDCLLKQTIEDWECIIVNDGSTDSSLDIMKEYVQKDSRYKYIDKKNGGPALARNVAIAASSGKYILPLDADDLIAPSYSARAIEYLDRHEECTLYYAQTQYLGNKNEIMNCNYSTYKDLLAQNSIVCTCVFRRVDFDRIGGFDEKMRGYEDWEFFIRLLYQHDIVYQDQGVMFYYRIYDNPQRVNTQAKMREEELRSYFFNKHYDKYKEYYGYPQWIYGQYNRLEHEIQGLLNSNAYRIGHKIIAPLQWIENLLK